MRTPVFVVGHARSGTTLLHRLLSEDTERFSVFLYWELFFPSLLQKKVIRWLIACDRRFGGRIATRVRGLGGAHLRPHAAHPPDGAHDAGGGRLRPHVLVRVGLLDRAAALHGRARLLPRRRHAAGEAAPPDALLRGVRAPPALSERRRQDSSQQEPDLLRPRREPDRDLPRRAHRRLHARPGRDDPEPAEADADRLGRRRWDDARMQRSLRDPRRPVVPHLSPSARGPAPSSGDAARDRRLSRPRRRRRRRSTPGVRAARSSAVGRARARARAAGRRGRARESKHQYSLEEFGLERGAIEGELADLFATFGWRTTSAPGSDEKGKADAGAS